MPPHGEEQHVAHCKYLRVLGTKQDAGDPRPEMFLDETWVNQNKAVNKYWTADGKDVGSKLKTGKGERFIIVHAGGEEGIVLGALWFPNQKMGIKVITMTPRIKSTSESCLRRNCCHTSWKNL